MSYKRLKGIHIACLVRTLNIKILNWQTLNLLPSAEDKTNTKNLKTIKHDPCVMCHRSPTPTAKVITLTLINPPLCTVGRFAKTDIFIFWNQLLHPTKKTNSAEKKTFFAILAIHSLTACLKLTQLYVSPMGTDK